MKPSLPPSEGSHPDRVRLVPDRFRVTWLAALFGLLLGVTMTYVPYEFQTRAFDVIYPQIRLVGLGFLLGSIPLGLAALYPRRWPTVDRLGRLVLILTLAVYWYAAAVTTGSRTGLFLYPLMIACVAWEGWRSRPAWRYPAFLGLVSIIFGLVMVLTPSQFSSASYTQLQPVLRPVGLFYLAGGLGVLLAPWRRNEPLRVVLFGGLTLPFAYLAYALGVTRNWAGVEIYGVIALGCLLAAWSPWILPPASVRWRLLRGFVIAGLLPLLVLGGLASFLAQRAIEQETHANTLRAITTEAEWLRQYISDTAQSLQTLAASPNMARATTANNPATAGDLLAQLRTIRPEFGAVGLFDAAGQAQAVVGDAGELGPTLDERLGYADTLDGADVYLSEPRAGSGGQPHVLIVVPVQADSQRRALLAASVPLARLAALASAGSAAFPVQVVDTRAGLVIREPGGNRVLQPTDSLALAQVGGMQTPGLTEVSDGTRRYLTAYAPVPDTHWLVLVTQPISLLYGRITQLSGAVVGLVGVAVLLALLLSQWVAREVTDRLSEVQAAAGELAGGNLERRVLVEGKDELADLGRAFNHMAAELQSGQSELARVNAELQAAVQVRDDFISVASHELKTPLTPLKGFGQTLLRQLERSDRAFNREQGARVVRLMNQQVDRLAELVDDLLDTTRIRGGRFVLDRAPTDLVSLTREIVERFQNQSDTDGHSLVLEAPPDPVVGQWDARRLDQVLTNLVSNALRYSPPDTQVQVTVSRDAASALVAVKDHGIGIPPASLTSLFEPYYRAANASENYAGLGLGLYISREIVERHGGQIWAESAGAGQGSQFYVRLPL